MYKLRTATLIGIFLLPVLLHAQKPLVAAEKGYNFSAIESFYIEYARISAHDFVDPHFLKDTLTGLAAAQVAVANELGLKRMYWIDGHRHGTSLDIWVYILKDGYASLSDEYAHNAKVMKKANAKGFSVLIEMVDDELKKAVWTGWCALDKLKGADFEQRLRIGIWNILQYYPPK